MDYFNSFLKPQYEPSQRTRSLIKWAGGKGRVMPTLSGYFDLKSVKGKNYYEPFCGSCAVALFHNQDKMHLNDKNENLINFFEQVKFRPKELYESICELILEYNKCADKEKHYYYIRDKYNELVLQENRLLMASLLWILNHTGFNGMYRETKDGKFNIPYGKRSCPLLKWNDVEQVSKILHKANLYSMDFVEFCSNIIPNSFVYLDPPYIPATSTANFNSYLKSGFGEENHRILRDIMENLSESGTYVVLSNSDTDLTYDIYGDMKNFKIQKIKVNRSISGNAKGRASAKEIIISNKEYIHGGFLR